MKALFHLAAVAAVVVGGIAAVWGLRGLEALGLALLGFYLLGCAWAAVVVHVDDQHTAEPCGHWEAFCQIALSWLTVVMSWAVVQ